MKLFERLETERTQDRLPELPPGVEVPDDISGLRRPTTPKPPAGGVRWMRWLAAIVLLGAAAVLLSSSDPDPDPVDYMTTYGTDNPVVGEEVAVAGTVEIVGTAPSNMELYGTDNPVLVEEAAVADTEEIGELMRLYGTDNPVFIPEPSNMELYGTDNPVFVER